MEIAQWTFSAQTTIAIVFAVVAVVGVVTTAVLGRRRRRLHRLLIKDAITELCAFEADEPIGVRRKHRDLARMIGSQVGVARVLDELIRPQVPDRPGKRNPVNDVLIGEAVAAEINGMLLGLWETGPLLPEWREQAGPTRRAHGPLRPIPRLSDVAPITEVLGAMRTTLRSQVRQVQIVVRHAEQLGLIEQKCRDRLRSALAEVVEADRDSEKLALAGHDAAAVGVLAEVKMPVPEDGVPGAAARRDLEDQAVALAQMATAYRDALVDWCLEALDRCGVAAATMPQNGAARI